MRSLGVLCLIILGIFFALLQIGSAYQCYTCAGASAIVPREMIPPLPAGVPFTNSCIDATDLTKLGKMDCSDPKKACVKSFIIMGDAKVYTRACADPEGCKALPKGSECYSCNENLCNSSTYVFPSVVTVGVIALVFAKYFL